MFYVYSQNNSGGEWDGEYAYVVVQANSADEANAMAEEMGCYFDGVEKGVDCDCCGDRWCAADEGDGYESLEKASKWMLECEFVQVKENVWVVLLEEE